MSNKKRESKPQLGWEYTTVANLINYLNEENGIGKKKQDSCNIDFKGQSWKLQRVK